MGRLDLFITKSVSNFVRNTVDTLPAISKRKEYSVEVCFDRRSLLSEKKEAIAKAQKKTARRRTSTVENAQTNQVYKGTRSSKKRTARIIF